MAIALVVSAVLGTAAPDSKPVDCGRDAPAFMAAYARDLSAGDRAAIAGRYSRSGAYSLGFGAKSLDSPEAITKRYAGPAWQKPDAFEWQDLSYEQLGPATCLVAGGFRWTKQGRTGTLAYTSVLRAEEGGLRIMLEHENLLKP